MRRTSWAGFPGHVIQEDFAVAASQGEIADRTHEFLNAADQAVIHVRKLIADAATNWLAGNPISVKEPEMLAYGLVVPAGTDWRNVPKDSEYLSR